VTGPTLEARLTVTVGDGAFSVDADLRLDRGVLVLFGPSGAGKSLTLQALVGLIRPSDGYVRLGGEPLFDAARGIDVPTERRRIGYVPQHNSLFPFCDVAENVAFGLPRADRRRDHPSVVRLMDELGLTSLARARPDRLSGGERQRVALARALAVRPRLLVLDEPFASIDQDGRTALRRTLIDALEQRPTPVVFVTHDPDEAIALGDAVVRFERGRSTETGSPDRILRRGHPVTVCGRPVATPESLGGGTSRLALGEVAIEAPTDLLEPGEDGLVRLELRTRPRSPRP
jgi:molybdate transport system ATP-binding protein